MKRWYEKFKRGDEVEVLSIETGDWEPAIVVGTFQEGDRLNPTSRGYRVAIDVPGHKNPNYHVQLGYIEPA